MQILTILSRKVMLCNDIPPLGFAACGYLNFVLWFFVLLNTTKAIINTPGKSLECRF